MLMLSDQPNPATPMLIHLLLLMMGDYLSVLLEEK
jgi:hypothetical protein